MDTVIDTTLTLTWIFNTDIHKVFAAWTDATLLSHWFAPSDTYTTQVFECDLKVQGRYKIAMTDPEGKTYTVSGRYQTIEPPTKLVFDWAWEHEPDDVSTVTILLRTLGKQTEMILIHEGLPSMDSAKLHDQGWVGCIQRLTNLLHNG